MTVSLLSSTYAATFIDDEKYSGRVSTHLTGLASAVEDSHPDWRPTVSQLVVLLPESEASNAIVASGMAYGPAKQIGNEFPGPAILLFGAALNVLGSAPNTEMLEAIERSRGKIQASGLHTDEDIKLLVRAAEEREI